MPARAAARSLGRSNKSRASMGIVGRGLYRSVTHHFQAVVRTDRKWGRSCGVSAGSRSFSEMRSTVANLKAVLDESPTIPPVAATCRGKLSLVQVLPLCILAMPANMPQPSFA